MIDEVSIIIPTWNSMPEFEKTLKSIPRAFPEGIVKEIIVVDKHSTDGTVELARKHECTVRYDDISLGSARMKGLRHAKTEWIVFIDSDIELPEGWFNKMMEAMEKAKKRRKMNDYEIVERECSKCPHLTECWTNFELGVYNAKKMKKLHPAMYRIVSGKIGWIYGRTIDAIPKLAELRKWKMGYDLGNGYRILKEGKRAFTNNTLCLREPLLNAKIEHLNAWEDYVLTQEMLKAGYNVVEVPIACTHNHKSKDKWGFYKSGWNVSGMIKVAGVNSYTFGYLNYYLFEGVRATIHFRDLYYLKWGMIQWMEALKGVFKHDWKRE